MGENEQGGMLRTVVVVGLVAMVALIITLGVVGLKASLRTNTLMGATMGQNIIQPQQNSSDRKYKFNVLTGSERMNYDTSTGVLDLKKGAVPNNAKTYMISFQTREASHVVYKSGSATFYE